MSGPPHTNNGQFLGLMGYGARCGGHVWAPAYEEERAVNHAQTSDPTPGCRLLTLPSPQRGEGKTQMHLPPSTGKTLPVIIAASSEARKRAAAARSSGLFSRPSGTVPR